MSSEIMRFQMGPNHLSCFIHNLSPGRIGYWKYPLIRLDPFSGYVLLEAVCNLLRNEDDLPFLATFGSPEGEPSVLDIVWSQFQDFADPHSAPGHQLKDQPVPGSSGSEDDLIYHFLFQNGPSDGSRWPIQLFQQEGVAWTSKIEIQVLGDKVEERSQLGVPGSLR